MIIPVRCFTCGKVIGNMWERYQKLCETMDQGKALDELGLIRFCCRRMLLTHVEIIDTVILYSNSDEQKTDTTDGKDEVKDDSSSSSSSSNSIINSLSTTNRIVYKKPEKEPRIYICR